MQLFFTNNIEGNIATFEAEEARHIQVLRKKIGDVLHFVDGEGGMYKGEIIEVNCTSQLLRLKTSLDLNGFWKKQRKLVSMKSRQFCATALKEKELELTVWEKLRCLR